MYHVDQLEISKDLCLVREQLKALMPDNPLVHGWASFSQCDEDGIIRECLRRIAQVTACSRTFIEIGCADGLENNTHQLVLDGYKGVWVEGSQEKAAFMSEQLGGLQFERLLIKNSFVDLGNISQLIQEAASFLHEKAVDFFSLDVDGNDWHLMKVAIDVISPKLICVEYNGKFPPPSHMVMEYNAAHEWMGDDYYGASLQAWIDALPGYTLVACNASGANAFFVRNDLAGGFTQFPVELLHKPPRYWLANGSLGHKNSLKWLRQAVQ